MGLTSGSRPQSPNRPCYRGYGFAQTVLHQRGVPLPVQWQFVTATLSGGSSIGSGARQLVCGALTASSIPVAGPCALAAVAVIVAGIFLHATSALRTGLACAGGQRVDAARRASTGVKPIARTVARDRRRAVRLLGDPCREGMPPRHAFVKISSGGAVTPDGRYADCGSRGSNAVDSVRRRSIPCHEPRMGLTGTTLSTSL